MKKIKGETRKEEKRVCASISQPAGKEVSDQASVLSKGVG